MEQIKEENKNLIASKNNYYTVIIALTAGIVWLFLADVDTVKFVSLLALGLYFDGLYILRLQNCENRLKKNIERLK